MHQTLDVGCGDKPRGNVNIDLYTAQTPHLQARTINPHTTPNFIQADANHLPFKNKTFTKTTCMAVLEHKGVHFTKTFKELIRVTTQTVTFMVPHRFAPTMRRPRQRRSRSHANRPFTIKTLDKWLRKQGYNPIITLEYKYYPHKCLPILRLPNGIHVTIHLKT